MANVFARSGEKAINLFRKHLFRTQITLAIFYFIVAVLMLGISSEMSKAIFVGRIAPHFEERIMIEGNRRTPAAAAGIVREELRDAMLLTNGVLLTLAGAMGYFLAGLTLEPLKKSYEKEQQFLSDASHELRTPLTILRTSLENLENNVGEKHKTDVKDAIEEVDRMHHLLQNILLISRAERLTPAHTAVPVHALIEQVVKSLTPLAQKEQQSIIVANVDSKEAISGDKQLLERALANVVENAILYNQQHGTVTISAQGTPQEIQIMVTDTGIGMSDEDIALSTERFYRAEKSRARVHGGSGLGLSIVEQIVKPHQGSLAIKSAIGKGTTVTLTLPIHKAS